MAAAAGREKRRKDHFGSESLWIHAGGAAKKEDDEGKGEKLTWISQNQPQWWRAGENRKHYE